MKHYHKINIFGNSGVGKTSLISHMENYKNDNFILKKSDSRNNIITLNSLDASFIVEPIRRVKIPIDDKNPLYLSLYETNLDKYITIKINLDTLLLQTECIIILWDYVIVIPSIIFLIYFIL